MYYPTLQFSDVQVVPFSLPHGPLQDSGNVTLEVSVGQTIQVALESISKHSCNWNWESCDNSANKPTVFGQHRYVCISVYNSQKKKKLWHKGFIVISVISSGLWTTCYHV